MVYLQEIETNARRTNNRNAGLKYKSKLENISRGLRVKFYRIQKGITLKDVAAGNLSQENLRLAEMAQFPLEDKIYKKLCLRLGITLEPIANPVVESGILDLKSKLTHIRNRAEMVELFSDIQSHPKSFLKEVYQLELMVHSIRYHIVTGDVVSALAKYKEAVKYKDLMNAEQLFFLNKYRGNIYFSEGHFEDAIDSYKTCQASAPLNLPPAEMADLYYTLGITSAHMVIPYDAKIYLEKALELYQDMFYMKRIVECHVGISLAEHRVRNFKSGLTHLTKASLILDEVGLPELRYLVEYNFGYFSFLFQDFEATVRHMEQCLALVESGNVLEELRCYTVLIKANWELNQVSAAMNWCDLGTRAIIDMETSSLSNKSVAEVFHQFHMMKALIYDNNERFEYLAEKEVLPHFEINGYDIDYAYYCTLVANYYNSIGKTHKSAGLYKKAGAIYRKVISISS